jgi:dienelactone hydrolase
MISSSNVWRFVVKKFLFLVVAFVPALASAAVRTEVVEYKHGGAVLEGFAAWDDALPGKRPGVLVIHEWMGLNDFAKQQATRLAELGYVAFAADIYGKGIRPATVEEAGKTSGFYKNDRQLLRGRGLAGLKALQRMKSVDDARLAVIGFCFGGTAALELARAGAPLKGVVTFHGGLSTPTPEDAVNIRAKVLALHGADDPYVTQEEVAGFIDEMKKGKVDWQLVQYSGAVHGFTNPTNGTDPKKGAAYNEKAAARAWKAMTVFFDEIFKTAAR